MCKYRFTHNSKLAGLEQGISLYSAGSMLYDGQKIQYSLLMGEALNIKRSSIGKYRITHNLGHQKYFYIATPAGGRIDSVISVNIAPNYFDIELMSGGSLADGACRLLFITF